MAVSQTAQNNDLWTTRRLLAWMIDTFTRKELDSPRIQAEMLLEHVFSCKRLDLYTDADRPASPLERQALRDLIGRALKHEPVQYLVGGASFFGMNFKVDSRVLIPRASSATIVEEVLQHIRATRGGGNAKGEGLLLGDVCTGSGCIAIVLLKNLPLARAAATDVSQPALDVARVNAIRHGVMDRLDILHGDLLAPLRDFPATAGIESLDYLVSNPPYIPDHEWGAVEANVKDYEPHSALRGGPDGLDFIRPLIADGPRFVKAGGLMLIETATAHIEQAAELCREHGELDEVRVLKDIDGLERVVVARKRKTV